MAKKKSILKSGGNNRYGVGSDYQWQPGTTLRQAARYLANDLYSGLSKGRFKRLVRESRNGFKIKVITTQQGVEWITSADSLLQSKNIMVFTTCSVGSAQWPKWYSLLHVVPPLLGNEAIHV